MMLNSMANTFERESFTILFRLDIYFVRINVIDPNYSLDMQI